MRVEKRTVDLNAYISNLECVVKTVDNKKQLSFSFKNNNFGTVVAIKLLCVVYDSFDDKIQFNGNDFLEVKRADLQIKPSKRASFSIDVDKYDVKRIEVSATQIVYADGKKVVPKEPKVIEYEVEILSSSLTQDGHFEKDALTIMREKNDKAICFPKIHPEGWVCVCGTLNSESENICAECGSDKQGVFRKFNKEIVKSEVEEREKKERDEMERKREQEKIKQEKERKKKKTITITIASIIALAIIIGKVYSITYNIKYGLSDDEKIQYDIAQGNDNKIEDFVLDLYLDYHDIAEQYNDDNYNYNHNRENRMRDAEKNKDYIYARGIYLAAPLLYDLIEDQYPEKYQKIYAQLVELRKGNVYNNILIEEKLYVQNSSASNLWDRRDGINEAIDIIEKYMDNDTLNPTKIKSVNADVPTPDYSMVYGINLGILYYEDGNIRYIGEISNGQANGFGRVWYSKDDGGDSCCIGTFENGVFKSGDSYNIEGNSIQADELSDMTITGEFEEVEGLSNTASSEYIAQQNANNEERDKSKAQEAVKDYLNMLVEKQTSITNITWINIPDVSGDYYYFSCTVEYDDLKRKGTVTVKKKSDGTFEATGLEFED